MSFFNIAVGVIAVVGAATSITLGAMSASSQKKAAKRQLEAQSMDAKIKAEQRIKSIRRLAGQQKSSFLSSGISLTGEGTPDAVISDTYDVGMQDVENIKNFGAIQGENISATARANMMSTYGQMASDVSSYASLGLKGAGGLASAGDGTVDLGGGLEGMGDSYGGFGGAGSGSSLDFNNFEAPTGFGTI